MIEAGEQRRLLAEIARQRHHLHVERFGRQRARDRERVVAAAVVDIDRPRRQGRASGASSRATSASRSCSARKARAPRCRAARRSTGRQRPMRSRPDSAAPDRIACTRHSSTVRAIIAHRQSHRVAAANVRMRGTSQFQPDRALPRRDGAKRCRMPLQPTTGCARRRRSGACSRRCPSRWSGWSMRRSMPRCSSCCSACVTSSLIARQRAGLVRRGVGSYVMNSFTTFAAESGRKLRCATIGASSASGIVG